MRHPSQIAPTLSAALAVLFAVSPVSAQVRSVKIDAGSARSMGRAWTGFVRPGALGPMGLSTTLKPETLPLLKSPAVSALPRVLPSALPAAVLPEAALPAAPKSLVVVEGGS